MKFNCGLSSEEKKLIKEKRQEEKWAEKHDRLIQWHEWFAWHPVRVGRFDCRWLEKVERKGTYMQDWLDIDSYWNFEYKGIDK